MLLIKRIGLFLWFKLVEVSTIVAAIAICVMFPFLMFWLIDFFHISHHFLKGLFFGFIIFLVGCLAIICMWDWLKANWKKVCEILPDEEVR